MLRHAVKGNESEKSLLMQEKILVLQCLEMHTIRKKLKMFL